MEVATNGTVIAVPFQRRAEVSPPFTLPTTEPYHHAPSQRFVRQVGEGWLIGWNAGEWGGAVWWFSAKGTNRYLVAEKRVIGFFPDGDGFLAPAGLAHLSDSHGEMIRLFKKEGRWSSQTVIGLGAAPTAAVLIEPDTMIVATTDRLLRYQVGGRLSVILNEIPWDPIFPNSIAADDDGRIFLGMRGGVAKVEKAVFGYRAYWLSPPANTP